MEKKEKTFKEIESQLTGDLKKIKLDISELENHIQIGTQMLEAQVEKQSVAAQNNEICDEDIIFKYKNDLAELKTGVEIFKQLEKQMTETLQNLYDTKKKADEYMK
jgi:hypothetical protein